jgi:hypothetical protein
MSNLQDIFDLPEESKKAEPIKKERKKPEMSDEKKQAMLERLAKGRETRANNLLAKKGGEPKKEASDIKVEEKKKYNEEEERKGFINMITRTKNEPSKKYERPKKKVYDEPVKVEPVKVEPVKVAPKVEQPKVEPPKVIKPVATVAQVIKPVAPPAPPAPVIIRAFKRAMWG